MAGGDEKKMNQLKRFTDVGKLSEAYFNAQEKIRAGETSNGLPDNPTDEQLTAYREANNVPATAADYALSLDEGLVLGEMDEGIMKGVYDVAHQNNVSNEAVSQMTNAMLKGRELESQMLTKQDGLDVQNSNAMLRDNWGQDYEMNVGLVQGVLGSLPESVRDDFASARLADGTAVFNSPEMMNFFAEAARAINPAATVVPAGTGNPTQAVTGRIAELEGKMSGDGWHKDSASQKELLNLYDARERLSK
jgi:Tfp pilus tip-associated adhesin PilY1